MKTEYELIKEDYGERFAKFCRSSFPTLIKEQLLYKTISTFFAPTKKLYDCLIKEYQVQNFINFINKKKKELFGPLEDEEFVVPFEEGQSPQELMKKAGYELYECKSEQDVLRFKKYYAKGEELCTFRDVSSRLKNYYIFFAVKENVDEIKRKNFARPERQDKYGTSVICLQFFRGKNNYLSIKNRYNHAVDDPDCTFNNNLDNIIKGLTASFKIYYDYAFDMEEKAQIHLTDYIRADGKYYYYNCEWLNRYFCENNIIIYHYRPYQYDKSRYEFIEHFVLDKKEKRLDDLSAVGIENFGSYVDNSVGQFQNIRNIEVEKQSDTQNRIIKIFTTGFENPMEIVLDNVGGIIEVYNPNIEVVEDYFFATSKKIKKVSLPNATTIKNHFLVYNHSLEECNLPKVKTIGYNFLKDCDSIKKIEFPMLEKVSGGFMSEASNLMHFYAPKLAYAGFDFLMCNKIKKLELPSLIEAQQNFLRSSEVEELFLPNCVSLGELALELNINLRSIYVPKIKKIGCWTLENNEQLRILDMPEVEEIAKGFLSSNRSMLTEFYAPKLKSVDAGFLKFNSQIKKFYAPNVNLEGTGLSNATILKLKVLNYIEKFSRQRRKIDNQEEK